MSVKKLAVLGAACAVVAVPATSAQARSSKTGGVVVKVDRGGKGLNVVAAHGRVKHLRLARKAPSRVRGGSKVVVSGGKVISARGRASATRLRAKVVNRRGHLTAVTTDGTPLSVVIGNVNVDLSGIPAGSTVVITVTFDADGKPVVTVTLPGVTAPPVVDPAVCPTPAVIGTILAINRSASRVMVQKADGERATFTAPADSLTSLKRGDQVLIADADSDGTAEAISALSGTARQLDGEVAWIDSGWGAFGLQKSDGTVEVVDASACQLANLSEGDTVTTVVHTDADGEVIADAVTVADQQSSDDDYWGAGSRSWPRSWHSRG
ncbi:MAG: hypothetical protein F2799_04150 [Actinobacteria bacterium]|uniref:Unannotated protein n=1 Tax=freshwater metagenome TaxID=449393 RepID=A0A6J7DZ04_9ZZZZ|nr:hypothetical protein [Actinomycetota bacterium]